MGIRNPQNHEQDKEQLEGILYSTLKDEGLREEIKGLLAPWKDYSYTPRHYIEILGMTNLENWRIGRANTLENLAINPKGFWKLDYEWESDFAGNYGLFFEVGDYGEWKFKDIKQLIPKEVINEFPIFSANSFPKYLEKALKIQTRDNKWLQKYGLLPEDGDLEKLFVLGINRLSEALTFPFSYFSKKFNKCTQTTNEN